MASDGDSLFDGMDFVTSVEPEVEVDEAEIIPDHLQSANTRAEAGHVSNFHSALEPRKEPVVDKKDDVAENRLNQNELDVGDAEIATLSPSYSESALISSSPSFGLQSGPLDESLFSDLSVEHDEAATETGNGMDLESAPEGSAGHATASVSINGGVSAGTESEGGREADGVGPPSMLRGLSSESLESKGTAEVDTALAHPVAGPAVAAEIGGMIVKQAVPRKKKRSIRVGYGRDEEEESGPARTPAGAGGAGGTIDLTSLYAHNNTSPGLINSKDAGSVGILDSTRGEPEQAAKVAAAVEEAKPVEESDVHDSEPEAQEDGEGAEQTLHRAWEGQAVEGGESEEAKGEGGERREGGSDIREGEESTDGDGGVGGAVEGGDGEGDGGEEERLVGGEDGGEADGVPEVDVDSLPLDERVSAVRERVESELKALHEMVSSLSAERKAAVQRRRAANRTCLEVCKRVRELEGEVAEACEKEEFERADELSIAMGEAEGEAERMGNEARGAEEECELAGGRLHEAEAREGEVAEEGARKLLAVQEAAVAEAQRLKSEAGSSAAQELERLIGEEEEVEARKRKVSLEQRVVEEEEAEMEKKILESTVKEQGEREVLVSEREAMEREVEEAREVLRGKEAALAIQDEKIGDVEEKIRAVGAKFDRMRANLEVERERVAETAQELAAEMKRIEGAKEAVRGEVASAESRVGGLEEVGRAAKLEAESLAARAEARKGMAAADKAERAKREELAAKEKEGVEKANAVKAQVGEMKTALKEIGFVRAKLAQEVSAAQQRLDFADKRGPELEAEKRAAASSRNFKEAAKLAAEMKMIANDKEAAAAEMASLAAELAKVEGEERGEAGRVAELEGAIGESEKAAAMARCERLRLGASVARKEMELAAEAEEFEEAESLKFEAESVDEEADALQVLHGLTGREYDKAEEELVGTAAH